jgi:dephospho-CoA kinase
MKVLGLTGGIGMGKSTASKALRRARFPVFDADAAVHRLQAKGGRALPQIAALFPGTVQDGVLDRAALRAIVLNDREKLRQLEKILHPLVRAEQQRFLARARAAGARLAVLDIPLLFEGGGDRNVDYTMVVSAPRAIQVARVRRRRRMSDAEIDRIIALQMPDAEKRRRADVVIRTGLSRFHAVRAIKRWLKKEVLFLISAQSAETASPGDYRPSPPASAPRHHCRSTRRSAAHPRSR